MRPDGCDRGRRLNPTRPHDLRPESPSRSTSIICWPWSSLLTQRNAATIVIAAPYRDIAATAPEANLIPRYRLALRKTMEQQRVPLLEILELTEKAYPSNEGWFGERIHPNHMGHRLMTSELLKLITSNRMLVDLNIPILVP